jgi:hypothetical protein
MQERRKTETRTIRFDIDLLKRLKTAALNAGKSENAFVNEVMQDRLLIDPLVRAFHEVKLNEEILRSILGGTDADTLQMAGSEMARKEFPLICELYRTSGHPLAFREFLTVILGEHYGWFSEEGDGDGNQRWMTLTHPFGRKWSIFVKSYILSAYGTISKDKIQIEIADQFIRIDFSPE